MNENAEQRNPLDRVKGTRLGKLSNLHGRTIGQPRPRPEVDDEPEVDE